MKNFLNTQAQTFSTKHQIFKYKIAVLLKLNKKHYLHINTQLI